MGTKRSSAISSAAGPVKAVPAHSRASATRAGTVAPKTATPKSAPFVRKPVRQAQETRRLISADLNPAAQNTLLATLALQGAQFRALAEADTPTVVTAAQTAPLQRTYELVFVSQIPPIRVQRDVIETTPQRGVIEVEPVRAEMQVIPTRHNLDLDEQDRQRIQVLQDSVRITGLALSVEAVWWASPPRTRTSRTTSTARRGCWRGIPAREPRER